MFNSGYIAYCICLHFVTDTIHVTSYFLYVSEQGANNQTSYVGCFVDKTADRDFDYVAWDSLSSMSTVKCVEQCYELSYAIAGLQVGEHNS